MDGVQEERPRGSWPHQAQDTGRQELERKYEDLVVNGLAGVLITTVDGRMLECNQALADILGYSSRQELMERGMLELYHSPADRESFLQKLREEKRLINHELTLKHRKGRSVDALVNVFLHEPTGAPATIQGSLIDITAFKQAQLEQRSLVASYRSLVEHIRDGLLLVLDGRIRYANPAAIQLAGRDPVGSRITELFHEEDLGKVRELMDHVTRKEVSDPVHVRSKGDGQKELLLFAAITMHQGGPAIQLTLQDQTAQQSLMKERLRVQMVEEVNQVLRLEIAEHRRTQEQLRHSRRFARGLVDSSLDMIMAADPEGRITEYNPAAFSRFGWEPQEVLGRNSIMLYADPAQYQRIQDELNENGVFAGEVRNVTKYGEVFTSFLAASRLYDEDGQLLGAMGVSRDITQMQRDQEALRISEERYRDLFENATDLIQSIDVNGRFEYVNSAWRKTLGYTDEELDRMTCMEIIHPEHKEEFQRLFKEIMEGGRAETVNTVFISKDGQPVFVEGTTSTRMDQGRPIAMRSIFRDVTNVHLAREKVQAHEAKLRALFESSEHMFWTVDKDMKITSYNRGYGEMIERLHGTRPDLNTDVDRPRKLFASPEYHEFWEQRYAEAFAGKAVRFETDLRDRNGDRVSNEVFLSPVFGPQGRVTEVFGVGHEITEQKIAEDLVREQAARLKAIFESSANMMIWTLDRDLRITSCNDHFKHMIEQEHGIRFEVGDAFVEAMSSRVAGGVYKPLLARYHATLKGKAQQFEVELINKDGASIWVENFLNPIETDGEVKEISCLAYGITDRKAAQMEILRSLHEKEVLLKEVHHRVKNNLQVISSILSLQTAHVGDDKRILDLLRDSRDRIRSMSFIHESLYQTKDLSSIDLANYIDGLSRNLMMSYSLTGKIALETELERVPLVLDQAIPCGLILNELISNALKHAFPGGREGVVRINLRTAGEKVSIRVSDSGVGVPSHFDVSRDGNLGLELVRTLVDQLDGRLEMDNTGPGVSYLVTFERTK